MENINFDFIKDLSYAFYWEVRKEYSVHKMSGQLSRSMSIMHYEKEKMSVITINPKEYDVWTWWYRRVVIPTGGNSYALSNDAGYGGLKRGRKNRGVPIKTLSGNKLWLTPTHNHNDFVERCVKLAVAKVCKANKITDYKITTRG